MNIQETYTNKKIDNPNILNVNDAVKYIDNTKKCVFISGVTGQDGSHMVDFLLEQTDFIIFGGVRRLSVYNHKNISHINNERFHLINFDLIDSHSIARIIEKIKPNFIEFFKEDKKTFLNKLLTYVEQSFDDNYNYIITSTHNRSIYPWKRTLYYYEDFSTNKKILYPGSGGDDCIIIAYDCLLLSKNNYEKLIYTSMLNIGDSDTIGSIASAWYGALYGFKNIPLNLIIDNNLYQTINKYAIELHTKYFNK